MSYFIVQKRKKRDAAENYISNRKLPIPWERMADTSLRGIQALNGHMRAERIHVAPWRAGQKLDDRDQFATAEPDRLYMLLIQLAFKHVRVGSTIQSYCRRKAPQNDVCMPCMPIAYGEMKSRLSNQIAQ